MFVGLHWPEVFVLLLPLQSQFPPVLVSQHFRTVGSRQPTSRSLGSTHVVVLATYSSFAQVLLFLLRKYQFVTSFQTQVFCTRLLNQVPPTLLVYKPRSATMMFFFMTHGPSLAPTQP